MRLIDADRLIDEFEDTVGSPIARTRLKLQVQNQPTIDAVEVVRCKDCKHFAGDGMYCDNDIMVLYDHFYCYYGEKEEDDE